LILPDGLLARYLRLTDLMLEFGSNLGVPHTKAIKDRLMEFVYPFVQFCVTTLPPKLIITQSFTEKKESFTKFWCFYERK
jgi:hypothetical protein